MKTAADLEAEAQIVPVSGFRTREDQEDIYRSSMEENGKEYTVKYVAPPDGSEHQTGLAIDLAENVPDIDFIAPEFPLYGNLPAVPAAGPPDSIRGALPAAQRNDYRRGAGTLAFPLCRRAPRVPDADAQFYAGRIFGLPETISL